MGGWGVESHSPLCGAGIGFALAEPPISGSLGKVVFVGRC
jgi:hypothetical protein